jgi:hypothetical protein
VPVIAGAIHNWTESALSALSRPERETLIGLLEKVANAMGRADLE